MRVLIPAAIENQITEKMPPTYRPKSYRKAPTDQHLASRRDPGQQGRLHVPDILGNAGGVTVSYFEWVQDRQGFFWRESEVNERLMDIMVNAFDVVVKYAEPTRLITALLPTWWQLTGSQSAEIARNLRFKQVIRSSPSRRLGRSAIAK